MTKTLATKTQKYSEEELIEGLKANRRHAYDYLYDNYSAAIYGAICRIVNDEDKAADIMQDVFLKIWKKIGDYDPTRGRLFTWILNIARNTSIDLIRKEKGKYMIDIEESVGLVDRQMSSQPEIGVIDLRDLLEKLRPERKVLIDLVYLQGFTQEEAAEQLSIPLGTAKSRIRTALQELKLYFAV